MATALIILGAAALALAAVAFYLGNRLYNLALNPKSDRSRVFGAGHNTMEQDDRWAEWRASVDVFLAQNPPQSRYITARDGLRLHALTLENPGAPHGWVIVLHGYTNTAAYMGGTAMMFYQAGYSVLIPDCRGHGKSEGSYIGMGWHDRLDTVAWAETLAGEHPGGPMAIYGISMGGATVMMTAGEALPREVYALVEDCGYTSAWDEFAYQLRALFRLPPFPLLHCASLVSRLRAGYWLGEASALGQLKKARLPMLFIHGLADTFVPGHMLDTVYDACAAPKEKLSVPGAGHGMASSVLGEAYWQSVMGFLARHRPPGL